VSLAEAQVQRYSRAILLHEVGGKGQSALLNTGVRLTAGGPALLTAAAYLAAGGTPVLGPPGSLQAQEEGFLVSARDVGRPAEAALRTALEALNPDAVTVPSHFGTLCALPLAAGTSRPLVAVGHHKGRWVLWAASEEACLPCLDAVLVGAEPPDDGPEAIQVGALAAVLFQRLVLGLAPPLSGLLVGAEGGMETLGPPVCVHGGELPEAVWAEAVHHLEACYPEEGCGVLLQGPAGVRFVPLANAYDAWARKEPSSFPRDARSAFLFEPSAWLNLLRAADRANERVAYILHSHPDGQATFSAEDRAQAAPGGIPLLPGVGYLVVAVRAARAVEAGSARWAEGGFQQLGLCLPGGMPVR
jgi:proteasome lid subunit RPN8/RPN11